MKINGVYWLVAYLYVIGMVHFLKYLKRNLNLGPERKTLMDKVAYYTFLIVFAVFWPPFLAFFGTAIKLERIEQQKKLLAPITNPSYDPNWLLQKPESKSQVVQSIRNTSLSTTSVSFWIGK